jgi:thymidylate synthase
MPFKTIVTELLWFLRGETNIKYLVDNNCHIWDGDCYKSYEQSILESFDRLSNDPVIDAMPPKVLTQEEFINKIKSDEEFAKTWGELGPIYGKQWRSWKSASLEEQWGYGEIKGHPIGGKQYSKFNTNVHIDQIANLINDLKTNPDSRRLMVNAWNVGELDQMVLPPCHYGFQVYTRELSFYELRNKLRNSNEGWFTETAVTTQDLQEECTKRGLPIRAISLMWNQRSVDTFLGLPFNIASYGLLLEMLAKEVNMVPEELIGNLSDVHLYSNHLDAAKEQIGRELTFDEFWDSLTPKQKGSMEKPYEGETYNGINSRIELINIMSEIHNIPKRTREPFPLPTLKFNSCPITGISMEYQSIAQFEIENYQSHPTIKAPLSN